VGSPDGIVAAARGDTIGTQVGNAESQLDPAPV
jgi:hypothetical protein